MGLHLYYWFNFPNLAVVQPFFGPRLKVDQCITGFVVLLLMERSRWTTGRAPGMRDPWLCRGRRMFEVCFTSDSVTWSYAHTVYIEIFVVYNFLCISLHLQQKKFAQPAFS